MSTLLGAGRRNVPEDEKPTVRFERVLDAPQARVFEVWTRPEHILKWWRPRHFHRIDLEVMDVRPGGELRFRMFHPEGAQYVSSSIYREVLPTSRLVYFETCYENDRLFHKTLQTVHFDALGAQTRVRVLSCFEWVADRPAHFTTDFMEAMWLDGWKDNGEHMAAYLASLSA
ncbi:SRPBCC domain-containing protein [Viridibacterium curvum]|uniref:SRPBCC family protein n=1 Tax=Viridibacterium curvum TaxID=1101404 RepID=A0ABP9QJT3_9RHOO